MNKTIKLTIAALIATLATTVGMAAPAGPAASVVSAGDHPCC